MNKISFYDVSEWIRCELWWLCETKTSKYLPLEWWFSYINEKKTNRNPLILDIGSAMCWSACSLQNKRYVIEWAKLNEESFSGLKCFLSNKNPDDHFYFC